MNFILRWTINPSLWRVLVAWEESKYTTSSKDGVSMNASCMEKFTLFIICLIIGRIIPEICAFLLLITSKLVLVSIWFTKIFIIIFLLSSQFKTETNLPIYFVQTSLAHWPNPPPDLERWFGFVKQNGEKMYIFVYRMHTYIPMCYQPDNK